jgi:recombination protein RecR
VTPAAGRGGAGAPRAGAREPEALARLTEALMRLPGVGQRSAERLAHHLVRAPAEEAIALADAIRAARERVRPCSSCRAPAERDPCPVCADPSRDRGLLLVVETARDLKAIEESGAWRGLYHVLGARLSPLEGVGREALDLDALVARAKGVREVCLATNPDLEGDGTALAVERALAGAGATVTRPARGLPSGGAIEYASRSVLAEALENRGAPRGPRTEERAAAREPG